MTTTSPRRIPRRRDSSRQAAFTFLTNISLGTESYPSNSNLRATAENSHFVPSPSQPSDVSLKSGSLEKQQPPANLSDHEVLRNGKPNLQISTNKTATAISLDKQSKKTGGNHVLSPNPKNTDNSDIFNKASIEIHNEEHDFNKTRGRSNSLREEATNFLTNISLDPKKSKPYHPSREGVSDGPVDTDIIDDLSPNKNCRSSSESTYKSDSSSSSVNSITLNEKSVSRRKSQLHHPSSPNTLNHSNDQPLSHKQNNANSSSSMGFLSILGYDKKSKQKNRRDQMKQTTDLETTKRLKAASFKHLLESSHSLDPETDNGDYDPTYLDNPKTEKQPADEAQEIKQTKHRNVLSLSGIMGSLMHHNNRPSDLKRESNAQFRRSHVEDVDPTLTLSQIRKVKLKLLTAAKYEDLNLELSTVAKAYAYFEKLILKRVVNKANRRLYGSICLLLASKVNEPMGMSYSPLLESLHKHLDVTIKDITDSEFSVFAHLGFELYLPTQEFMPHFERLLQTLDYNKEEYLESTFYEFNLIRKPKHEMIK